MELAEKILEGIEDRAIDDIRVGIRYTAVRIGERVGVSRTAFEGCEKPADVGGLIGTKVSHLILSDNTIESTIGAAAINAQLEPSGGMREENVFDVILRSAGSSDRVGVVGMFPFVGKLEGDVSVFEMRPAPGCLPPSEAETILPGCDLVVITGSAFANGTLEHLLKISGGQTMVIGPSTPLSPALFAYGADLLAGFTSRDGRVLDVVGQGGGTRDFNRLGDAMVMESP